MKEITYRFLGQGRPNTRSSRNDEGIIFLNFKNKDENNMQSWRGRTRRRSHWRSLDMIQRFLLRNLNADEFANQVCPGGCCQLYSWLLNNRYKYILHHENNEFINKLLQLSRLRILHKFAKPPPSFRGHWCSLARIVIYKNMCITSNCCRTVFPFLEHSNFIWHWAASELTHTQSKD